MNPTCPICGMGQLVEHRHMLAHDGANVPGLRHSVCDHCGEYITTPEQSRQNKIRILAARAASLATSP